MGGTIHGWLEKAINLGFLLEIFNKFCHLIAEESAWQSGMTEIPAETALL